MYTIGIQSKPCTLEKFLSDILKKRQISMVCILTKMHLIGCNQMSFESKSIVENYSLHTLITGFLLPFFFE